MKNEVLLPEWESSTDLFNVYSVTIEKMIKAIGDLRVQDASSCKLAINASSDVKFILKDIQSIKKKTTEPYRQFINHINQSAKEFTDKLDLIQKMIVEKVSEYDRDLKIQSETAQKEAYSFFSTSDMDVNFFALNDEKVGSTAKTIVSHKTDKTFSVTNESLIPREYLKVDEDKVKQAIKLGISNIPGISIVETKKLMLRKR